MSFFSAETHQERARVVEARQQDVEEILSVRQQVAEDIVRRAHLAFVADGSVSEVHGHTAVDGSLRGDYDSEEYQAALRETESSVAEAFADSDSEVTVHCSFSSHEQMTGRWVNPEVQETVTVTILNAHATFEPPLT